VKINMGIKLFSPPSHPSIKSPRLNLKCDKTKMSSSFGTYANSPFSIVSHLENSLGYLTKAISCCGYVLEKEP